uniref:G_PROTEIN_RECEP_F1_2 domain-containing protein n=1 Tax=Haemonchus contortus TaxID=6289 RepID=A0A7I4YHK7_HAECO
MFVTLMAAAVIGNAVVMWIIYKHKVMHHGFNYFLFNMAFADLLIAVFNVGTSWTFNLYHDWWYGDICVLTSFFGIAPTTVSVFSMMALSWDRCQAVVRPLRKRPLSRRRSLITIAIIWAISTVTALPFAFAATVRELYLFNVLSREVSIRHACAAPAHPVFDHILFLIQYALPLFVLSLTFARIACAFRSTDVAAGSNSKASNHIRAKNKAVKMLSLMVITFMFCWLPYHLYHTFELNSSMEFENPNIGKYIYLCIYWIAMSSSAYNPVIYCFANERFRIGFRYVFRWMPMIQCSRENYEYSQLFPEKLRSMAITVQLNKTSREKNSRPLHRSYNSAAFSRCCNGAGGGAQQARRTYSARRINLKPDDV